MGAQGTLHGTAWYCMVLQEAARQAEDALRKKAVFEEKAARLEEAAQREEAARREAAAEALIR